MISRNEVRQTMPKFYGLLERLEAWKIDWQRVGDSYEAGDIRERAAIDGDDANAACSWIKGPDAFDFLGDGVKHVVALDLDIPAYLVPSTTEGHSHLYIDVPGGVKQKDYMALVELLGKIGVIEEGYAAVSLKRGFTDLRLPWVAKEERLERPVPHCCRCLKEATEIDEYRSMTADHWRKLEEDVRAEEIIAWVWANEGTINRSSGLFACTSCYIAMGQPSSATGWTPPGPDSIQPL